MNGNPQVHCSCAWNPESYDNSIKNRMYLLMCLKVPWITMQMILNGIWVLKWPLKASPQSLVVCYEHLLLGQSQECHEKIWSGIKMRLAFFGSFLFHCPKRNILSFIQPLRFLLSCDLAKWRVTKEKLLHWMLFDIVSIFISLAEFSIPRIRQQHFHRMPMNTCATPMLPARRE